MTLVSVLLLVVAAAAASLCVLVIVADQVDREQATRQEPYYPAHAEWTKDGATTRLDQGPPAARAGVHRAPSVWSPRVSGCGCPGADTYHFEKGARTCSRCGRRF